MNIINIHLFMNLSAIKAARKFSTINLLKLIKVMPTRLSAKEHQFLGEEWMKGECLKLQCFLLPLLFSSPFTPLNLDRWLKNKAWKEEKAFDAKYLIFAKMRMWSGCEDWMDSWRGCCVFTCCEKGHGEKMKTQNGEKNLMESGFIRGEIHWWS